MHHKIPNVYFRFFRVSVHLNVDDLHGVSPGDVFAENRRLEFCARYAKFFTRGAADESDAKSTTIPEMLGPTYGRV